MWNSPVSEARWAGFRRINRGVSAFSSLLEFEKAVLDELTHSLADHELLTLGRLLARGKKNEIELFIRTHGANPLFDPQKELDFSVGVAKADVISIENQSLPQAYDAILEGRIMHVLFQAGEATRFQEGPFYLLNPMTVADRLLKEGFGSANGEGDEASHIGREKYLKELKGLINKISQAQSELSSAIGSLLTQEPLGPKQPLILRASLRRLVHALLRTGQIKPKEAVGIYKKALTQQKILFFVSRRGGVSGAHDQTLRKDKRFFGFDPENVVTIEQELIRGVKADEEGRISLLEGDDFSEAAGHLYALIQGARAGDFTTYTPSGKPIKPMEVDAFSYLINRGARVINIIRINDMDRHTPEIINPKGLSYALEQFSKGYVNVIETVANPSGQKGGTGITFGDADTHVLTETHENSFPVLSRPFEAAMKTYLDENNGRHPAYNAMRQWADAAATRRVLKEWGGRIVFVPREGKKEGASVSYVGVDMPMGDLSLLTSEYKSRMFQFCGPHGEELLIHDMKNKEHLPLALKTLLFQLKNPHVIDAAKELVSGDIEPFRADLGPSRLYEAPAPEFD